jgi:hypothetical protein
VWGEWAGAGVCVVETLVHGRGKKTMPRLEHQVNHVAVN